MNTKIPSHRTEKQKTSYVFALNKLAIEKTVGPPPLALKTKSDPEKKEWKTKTELWYLVLELTDHLIKNYFVKGYFKFSVIHVLKHIKTIRLVVDLLARSWRIIKD